MRHRLSRFGAALLGAALAAGSWAASPRASCQGLAGQAPGVPAGSPAGPSAGLSLYRVAARADWTARLLSLSVELDVAGAGLRLPAGRLEAERMVERELPALMKDAVFGLQVDSFRSLGDTIADGSVEVDELLSLAELAERKEAVFSRDLKTFRAVYELPLLAAASLYVRHSSPTALRASMDFRPTKAYTGIVIYAKGELPLRGESGEAEARPCFFPRVFDEEMNLIVERNAVSPEALARWGEVGYAEGLSLDSLERVGESPLKLVAAAVFGTGRTDLVISRDDALKILGRPENRALVAEGRVLFVLDEVSGREGR